jgi:hypothetical protein
MISQRDFPTKAAVAMGITRAGLNRWNSAVGKLIPEL